MMPNPERHFQNRRSNLIIHHGRSFNLCLWGWRRWIFGVDLVVAKWTPYILRHSGWARLCARARAIIPSCDTASSTHGLSNWRFGTNGFFCCDFKRLNIVAQIETHLKNLQLTRKSTRQSLISPDFVRCSLSKKTFRKAFIHQTGEVFNHFIHWDLANKLDWIG